MKREINIKSIKTPQKKNLEEELKIITESMFLSSGRDIKNTGYKIIKFILEETYKEKEIKTEDISKKLKFPIARINHHIRRLTELGIVYREKRNIKLRRNTLKNTIEEVKRDADRIFEDLIRTAEEIDKQLEEKIKK